MNHILFKSILFGSGLAMTNSMTGVCPLFHPVTTTASYTVCESNPCASEPYYVEFTKIFDTMKKEMLAPRPTGNVTLDFLAEMIPHHEAAISMSKNILKYTKNPEIISIANTAIKEQTAGVQQMKELQKFLKENPPAPDAKEAEYLKNFSEIYDTMVTKMAAAKPTCNVDIDFLSEMIPHHDGALAMSKNVLNYTKNETLKSIATNIINTQTPQAKKLQELLAQLEK